MAPLEEVRRLEEITANAWPAPYSVLLDGWMLRYAEGYTRRANSVLPLRDGAGQLTEKIDHAEQFYRARSLDTTFKVTDAALPAELDNVLAARGYERDARTSVQTLDLTAVSPEKASAAYTLDIRRDVSAAWIDTFLDLNGVDDAHRDVMWRMLATHLMYPAYFVVVREDELPVGMALMVTERGHVGIFDVVVRGTHRGRGIGRWLMNQLLWLGCEGGAHTAYLQVMHDNEIAVGLYHSLGFRPVYDYWYRINRETASNGGD